MGSCQSQALVQPSIQYVSIVSIPKGSPKGMVVTKTPPSKPQKAKANKPEKSTMKAPTSVPKKAKAPSEKKINTLPNPNSGRVKNTAMEAVRRKEARRKALENLTDTNRKTSADRSNSNPENTSTDSLGLTEGADWEGMEGTISYSALVRATIESNWMPPTWALAQNQEITCLIHLTIGFDGRIVRRTLEKESGDRSFDQSAFAAVDKTVRLPIPPEGLRNYLLLQGMTLRFNPRSKKMEKQ